METHEDILSIEGCTAEEVEQVRVHLGGKIPLAYAEFLLLMGRMPRHIDIGVNCFFPVVLDAAAAFTVWRTEAETSEGDWYDAEVFSVPDGAIPIGHHDGYDHGFFAAPGDDPPILHMCEANDPSIWVDKLSFSNRVCEAIRSQAAQEVERLDRAH